MAKKKSSSTADILGKPKYGLKLRPGNLCIMCDKEIPGDRIRALIDLGTHQSRWTHTKCSTTTKIKGIYLGEVGTSEIMLCDKIHDDSVRSVFRRAEADLDPESSDKE